MALAESYSLKWHGHGPHLNSSISSLYQTDAFTDVILATSDGRYMAAHQFVLSACSAYLQKMFLVGNDKFKSNGKTIVILPPEVNYSTLTVLLQYIYKGEAIVNHDQLPFIMKAAELLQIIGLFPRGPGARPNRPSVLKQQNKNSADTKNNTETRKPSLKALIPEVKFSESGSEATNCISNAIKPLKSSSPTKSHSANIMTPPKKRQKILQEESLNNKSQFDQESSSVENFLVEKMIVGEEILVKAEPVDWEDQKVADEHEEIVKQEVLEEHEQELEEGGYVPLTCDLCQETFKTPALWVRHIEQTHPTTALASGKRATAEEGSSEEYPPLHCELCQQVFRVPAEWVRHIQTHSELALALEPGDNNAATRGRVECNVCGKVLQSQASMQIHARTHTGERPYLCKICGREFNVKSNFLRHMRTLHDQLVSANSID